MYGLRITDLTSAAALTGAESMEMVQSGNSRKATLTTIGNFVTSLSRPASGITFSPTGNVAATNVQAAIAEVDSEKFDKTGGVISGHFGTTAIPTDFWSGTNLGLFFPNGYMGSNGSFRFGFYGNFYRNNLGTSTSLNSGGSTGAAALEIDPSGVIQFRANSTTPATFNASMRASIDESGLKTGSDASQALVIDVNQYIYLRSFTVATLPSAATARRIIYVSDGTSNKRLAITDGTNWRWPDGAIVS